MIISNRKKHVLVPGCSAGHLLPLLLPLNISLSACCFLFLKWCPQFPSSVSSLSATWINECFAALSSLAPSLFIYVSLWLTSPSSLSEFMSLFFLFFFVLSRSRCPLTTSLWECMCFNCGSCLFSVLWDVSLNSVLLCCSSSVGEQSQSPSELWIIDTLTSNLTAPGPISSPRGWWLFDLGSVSIWAPAEKENCKEVMPCCFQYPRHAGKVRLHSGFREIWVVRAPARQVCPVDNRLRPQWEEKNLQNRNRPWWQRWTVRGTDLLSNAKLNRAKRVQPCKKLKEPLPLFEWWMMKLCSGHWAPVPSETVPFHHSETSWHIADNLSVYLGSPLEKFSVCLWWQIHITDIVPAYFLHYVFELQAIEIIRYLFQTKAEIQWKLFCVRNLRKKSVRGQNKKKKQNKGHEEEWEWMD